MTKTLYCHNEDWGIVLKLWGHIILKKAITRSVESVGLAFDVGQNIPGSGRVH